MSEKLKHAMLDPADIYSDPVDVLNDSELSQDDKRKILKNWHDEVQHILESGAENMSVEDESTPKEALLQKITAALDGFN